MAHSDDTITLLLSDVARILRVQIHSAMDDYGYHLTEAELRALLMIMDNPGSNQRTIAEKMEIDPMSLLGLLVQLERQGYITRERHRGDRRAKVLFATPKAEPALDARRAIGRVVRAHISDRLGVDESERLRRALADLREALREPVAFPTDIARRDMPSRPAVRATARQ